MSGLLDYFKRRPQSAASGARVMMNVTDGFKGIDASGNTVTHIDPATGKVTLKTAQSGKRLEIDPTNGIRGYDDSQLIFHLPLEASFPFIEVSALRGISGSALQIETQTGNLSILSSHVYPNAAVELEHSTSKVKITGKLELNGGEVISSAKEFVGSGGVNVGSAKVQGQICPRYGTHATNWPTTSDCADGEMLLWWNQATGVRLYVRNGSNMHYVDMST